MERKTAISVLKDIKNWAEKGKRIVYAEALTIAINSLMTDEAYQLEYEPITKNDLGVDCISREAVLEQAYAYGNGLEPDGYCVNVEDIQALPSVTPQEPKWIPTSVRKPEKGGEYLLWGKICEDEDDNYCFIGDYHEFDEVFGTEISNYDPKTLGFIDTEIEEYYSVVAWMPLPTDYSEVEE